MKGMRALFYFGLALACVVNAMASTRIERDISVHSGNFTSPAAAAVASESIIGTKVVTGAAAIKNGTVLGKHMAHVNADQKAMAQIAAKEEAHKYNNGARKAEDNAYVPTTVHPNHGLRTVGSYKPRRNQLDVAHPIGTYNSADRHEDIVNVEATANPTHGLRTVGSNKLRRNQLDMAHPIGTYNSADRHEDIVKLAATANPTHGLRTVGSNKLRRNQLDVAHPMEAYTAVHQISAPHINLYQRFMSRYHNAIQGNSADRYEDIPNVERYAPAAYGFKSQMSVKEFYGTKTIFKSSDPYQYPEGAAVETKRTNSNYPAQKYMEEERMQKEKYSSAGVLNAMNKNLDREHMQLRRNVLDAPRDEIKVQDFEKQFMQHKLAELKTELASYARQLAVIIEQKLESDEMLRSVLLAEPKDKHVHRPPAVAAATKKTDAAEKDTEDIVDAANVSINSDEEYNQAAQNFMDAGENMEQLMKLLSSIQRDDMVAQ